MARVVHQTRIGISGWTYAPWRGVFFPKELTQKRELEYASRQLNTIEINGSFYSLQRPSSFATWYAQTPDDFVFSVAPLPDFSKVTEAPRTEWPGMSRRAVATRTER